MGPEIMLRVASDALEWPGNNAEKCFDCIGWAQKVSWKTFPDVLKWAQK